MPDHRALFRRIVRAYQEDRLEEALDDAVKTAGSAGEAARVISALCGVEVEPGEGFSARVRDALARAGERHRVVVKTGSCFGRCRRDAGISQCEKACPFHAISIDAQTGEASIDGDKCTGCGLCVDACPEGVMTDVAEWLPVADMLKSGAGVIAAVAPAITGQFGGASLEQLRTAFRRLGLTDMVEVAFFADMLTLKEAFEFDRLVKDRGDFMITSCCCPIWVGMLRKVYHNLVPHVSPSVSPMAATGRVLKKLYPGVRVVFIGPCIAKKSEAREADLAGCIDAVLTFTELADVFSALGICPRELEPSPSFEYASRGGRLYARAGGVAQAVEEAVTRLFPEKSVRLTTVKADGVPACRDLLEKAQKGVIQETFVEGMGCVGGCVGGPRAVLPKERGREEVDRTAMESKIAVSLDSDCMLAILKRLGIEDAADFGHTEKMEIFERKF